jgi:hypothetical protein
VATARKHIIKQRRILLAPYQRTLTIKFTNDVDLCSKKDGFGDDKGFHAYCATYNTGNVAVVLPYNVSVPLAVHEATHAVLEVFNGISHDASSKDQEPMCYMMQYVVSEILKFQKEVRGKFNARSN